jgi:subtilisin family serine protease
MPRTLGRAHVALGACMLVLSFACSDNTPIEPSTADQPGLEARASGTGPRRHIIVLKEGVAADLTAEVQQAGGRVRRSHREIGVLSVEGLSDAAVASLSRRPEVLGINADVKVRWIPPAARQMKGRVKVKASGVRSQTDQSGAFFFADQWNMRVIQADDAWLTTRQGEGALVCVLDTGIDTDHPDLLGKVDPSVSVNFVTEEPFTDLNFHGTHVAGIISTNGLGVASVAPDARLCAVKVLDFEGGGSFDDVIAGIYHTGVIGADVANMSLGVYVSRKEEGVKELQRALQRAINFATGRGVLVVTSAGNADENGIGIDLNSDPNSFIHLPSELANVISVGATAPFNQANFDMVASYSNFGKSGVDVFAPGGDLLPGGALEDLILSPCSSQIAFCAPETDNEGNVFHFWVFAAGTSMAAPHVSGEGAVIESELPGDQRGQRLTSCILRNADQVTGRRNDPVYGKGRINVLRGVACQGSGPGEVVALSRRH